MPRARARASLPGPRHCWMCCCPCCLALLRPYPVPRCGGHARLCGASPVRPSHWLACRWGGLRACLL
eukprot:scaffold16056_cov22-Tisochrysis_lutea.AAC.5